MGMAGRSQWSPAPPTSVGAGWGSRSKLTVSAPERANLAAAASPIGPAPITTTLIPEPIESTVPNWPGR